MEGDLHVLAVQVNRRPANPSLKKSALRKSSPVVGKSIKVPSGEDELEPEDVRRQLKEAVVQPCNDRWAFGSPRRERPSLTT